MMILLLAFTSFLALCHGQSDQQIRDVTGDIWAADSQRVPSSACQYDINSNGDLYTYVDEGHFGKDTFASMRRLFDYHNPVIGNAETDSRREGEIWTFLNAAMNRNPMKIAHEFLVDHGLAPSSESAFMDDLYNYWFTLYTRSSGPLDSSGFEHVFCGEVRNSEVSGFHNWVQAYEEEKIGAFDYRYNVEYCEPEINTYSFDWTVEGRTYTKNIGGNWMCSSPEVELAIYTVCFLARTNVNCWAELEGNSVKIVTYDQLGEYVGSAYPACP